MPGIVNSCMLPAEVVIYEYRPYQAPITNPAIWEQGRTFKKKKVGRAEGEKVGRGEV
jgi:hypothetical protein